MRHGSLFSGIGGFDLASQWMGWENIFQVEWDDYAQKVLKKNFPNVTKYTDIKEFDATPYRGTVDIISGGFPCQPFSTAGKRKGREDDRYLWPETFRVICESRPTWILLENVAGLVNMEGGRTLDGILTELEDEGYWNADTNWGKKIIPLVIPACSVGAWHRRDRVWILAHHKGFRLLPVRDKNNGIEGVKTDTTIRGYYRQSVTMGQTSVTIPNGQHEDTPIPFGVSNGVPNWMDRLKGLGNAIVPQVAYEIFKAIDDI